jgi:uncharacterized protein YbjT (DUF2867 family)
MTPRTAVLLGASGLVGGHCLRELLIAGDYGRVIAILRRALSLASNQSHVEKLEQRVKDLSSLAAIDFAGVNDVFCALGTTISKAGSQAAFRAVDYELPMRAARAAKAAGAEQFLLVSSIGANPTSGNFYLRTKGELERDLATLGFRALHIFRPGLLLGARQEFRFSEALAQRVGPLLNLMMWGPLTRFRSVHAETVAKAMVAAALQGGNGVTIYEYDEIARLGTSAQSLRSTPL